MLVDRIIYLILKLSKVNLLGHRHPGGFTQLIREAKANPKKGKDYPILTF